MLSATMATSMVQEIHSSLALVVPPSPPEHETSFVEKGTSGILWGSRDDEVILSLNHFPQPES